MSSRKDVFSYVVSGFLVVVSFGITSALAESIPVPLLSAPPVMDGEGSDWTAQDGTVVSLRNIDPESSIETDSVTVRGGIYGNDIYFYFVWNDSTHNTSHKSWIWDEKKGKYKKDTDREDRLALQFEISGDYTTDWFAGNEFYADMWHWKSSRSNPLGLAHDKSTRVSKSKLLRAYQHVESSGEKIYLARPGDSGDNLYASKRYHAKQGDRLPKYQLNSSATGSITDIKASGKWVNGKWHLEFKRALDTGNDDDVVFKPGMTIKGGIAIFDSTENYDHAISNTLEFNLSDLESAELEVD